MRKLLPILLVISLLVGLVYIFGNEPLAVSQDEPTPGTNGMAYARINKSGCTVRDGNCQIRLDFFLESEDVRYYDRYLYLVDETSLEYLAGYPGEVDKDGNPVDQADYDKWWEGLPRVWVNTPFHTHFIYLPPDFTDEDIKAAIDLHLPNFYKAFEEGWDAVPGGMRHGWATETRIRPTDYSLTDTVAEYDARVAACEDAIASLTEIVYKPDGTLSGETFPATNIDVGPPCTSRSTSLAGDRTLVDKTNPANDTGTVDTFEVWAATTLYGTKVGTFYGSGVTYTNRDGETVGTVTAGAKRTFTALDIDVTAGDFAGTYYNDGGGIERDGVGGSGLYYKIGDWFGLGAQTYSSYGDDIISLYGTGETPVLGPTVGSNPATGVTNNSAQLNGNFSANGGLNITNRGFVWDTSSHGDPGNTAINETDYTWYWNETGNWDVGVFNFTATNLSPATRYFYRAGAMDSGGTWAYGGEVSFLTLPDPPTNVAATDGTSVYNVTINWTLSLGNITGYYVCYNGGTLLATVGNTTTAYNDTTASAPTITPGNAVATDGSSTSNVTASLAGESGNNGASRTYYVIAYNSAGNSTASANDTGYRGTTSLTYQWYKSAADADVGYALLGGATTDPYEDTAAPAGNITAGSCNGTDGTSSLHVGLNITGASANNGAGRWYLCQVSMAGATPQNSTHNRGYRGIGSLTYQWYRSNADADAGYVVIGGATTATYNDTASPPPTIQSNNATASNGTSSAYVTLSCNSSSSVGGGRWFYCVLNATGANSTQNTTHDRGYRGNTTLTYQWMRSSHNVSANFSNIVGATTNPYNDTGGVVWPDFRYYICNISMVGATWNLTSSDAGWKIPAVGPNVTTLAAVSVENTTANLWGNVTAVGDDNTHTRGFAWDTSSHAQPGNNISLSACAYSANWSESNNWTTGTFNWTGGTFTPATKYFYRAAANNTDSKWGWGNEVVFLTLPDPPTNVQASDGTYTNVTEITWTLSVGNVTGYYVMYSGGWLATVGNTTTAWNDTTSAAPTITPGNAVASDGSSTSNITLSLAGEHSNDGAARTYYLIAYNGAGNSSNSGSDSGYRGTTTLTYQWYNSTDGITYSLLAGATTDPYEDATAPAGNITAGVASATDGTSSLNVTLTLAGEGTNNGATIHYLCEVSMTDAASQNSTSNTGYRGVGALSIQWMVSVADADANYSNIAGATTDPYGYTGAPNCTIQANNATACDGCSGSWVTLSANESTADGEGRWFGCNLSAAGAAWNFSTTNRGYKGTSALSYQWMRSSHNVSVNFSNIVGGVTDPYNDVGGVVTPDFRYYICNITMVGAMWNLTSSDAGWKAAANVSVLAAMNATDISCRSALLWANITSIGGANVTTRGFDYGNATGVYTWSTNETGNWGVPGVYSLNVSGLAVNTTYFYRGFAINDQGTGYGGELNFTTLAYSMPGITNSAATNVFADRATMHGNITGIGCCNITMRGFEWGNVTGVYTWSWNETGSWGTGTYQHIELGLTCNTTYYWRAFITNCFGTNYSGELNFTTGACMVNLPLAPTNFTITQISGSSANLSWTIGVNASLTIIRGNIGGCPTTPADGYFVYNGTGSWIVVTGLNLDVETYSYGAWSWNPVGYSVDYVCASIGGAMFLVICLLALCIFLMVMSYRTREILVCTLSFFAWFGLGLWLFFSNAGFFNLEDSHTQVFVYVFMGLSFVPLIWSMNRSIRREASGQKESSAWTEEGAPPEITKPPTELDKWYDNRKRIRERLRR